MLQGLRFAVTGTSDDVLMLEASGLGDNQRHRNREKADQRRTAEISLDKPTWCYPRRLGRKARRLFKSARVVGRAAGRQDKIVLEPRLEPIKGGLVVQLRHKGQLDHVFDDSRCVVEGVDQHSLEADITLPRCAGQKDGRHLLDDRRKHGGEEVGHSLHGIVEVGEDACRPMETVLGLPQRRAGWLRPGERLAGSRTPPLRDDQLMDAGSERGEQWRALDRVLIRKKPANGDTSKDRRERMLALVSVNAVFLETSGNPLGKLRDVTCFARQADARD